MSAFHDPTVLPDDLPAPVDDGAAAHLVGVELPRLAVRATDGRDVVLADLAKRTLVLYVYPRTGRPGEAIPRGWDETPGARGCTPQSCAFRDRHDRFAGMGVTVAGLSAQAPEEQAEAAERLHLPFVLLADPKLEVAAAIGLPTFEFDGTALYKRLTLVASAGRIVQVFYPVFPPDENAAEVLEWLERHPTKWLA